MCKPENSHWVESTLREAINEFEQTRLIWLEGEYHPLNVKMVAELDQKIKAHREVLEEVTSAPLSDQASNGKPPAPLSDQE